MINRELLRDQSGATAVEYGLIIALIAVGALSAFVSLGGNVSATYASVDSSMANAIESAGANGAGASSGGASSSGGSSGSSSSSGGSSGGSSTGGSSGGSSSSSGGGSSSGGAGGSGTGSDSGASSSSSGGRTPVRVRDKGISR